MFKDILYAMDPHHLERYASFKDLVSLNAADLSKDRINAITEQLQNQRADGRELYTIDESGAAHIAVAGPLEPKPDACAIMFDMEMTTYQDIIMGIQAAEEDMAVNKIIFDFSTPGGNIVGLFAAADAIRAAKKPTMAAVFDLCASAGYALASQCGEIVLQNVSAEVGSIGIVTERVDTSGLNEGRGVKRYILTSENAENKVPDVTTEEGRDKIITRLNKKESIFIEYVASGRNTTAEDVKANFGRGGLLTAREAREAGMIDAIDSEINGGMPSGADPRNTTRAEEKNEGAEGMEMTQEQIEKIAADAANKAAIKASEETEARMTAEFDRREAAREAETARVAGFTKLKEKYPKMSGMIDDEMNKKGAVADVDFALKVADAATSAEAAASEQEAAAGDHALETTADTDPKGEQDQSGNILAGALGLKVEAKGGK